MGDTPSALVGVLCSFHSGLFTGDAQATLTLTPGCRPEPCVVGLMGGLHPLEVLQADSRQAPLSLSGQDPPGPQLRA